MADHATAQLVQNSWKLLSGDLPGVGKLFYTNLFKAHPEVRTTLFKDTNMEEQYVALPAMLNAAVENLEKPDILVPTLQALGLRHARYGCEEVHYDVVGAILIQTLAQGLGPKFTPEVKAAWVGVYGVVKTVMWEAECTPEGMKALNEYRAKNSAAKGGCCGCNTTTMVIAVAAVAIGAFFLLKKK
jgi:hemoglobin-like flavoprotein